MKPEMSRIIKNNDTPSTNWPFEAIDVFGKRIRTTKSYWEKIKQEKHKELRFDITEIIKTITRPEEVYKSIRDEFINIHYKKYKHETLVVVTKHLNGDGFLITAYQTSKIKRKGEKLWPK
ncbi:hypothetical protein HY030_03720 [Candidatus Gottesmanbacteria bacterium]|nr:hypothetical protein [Candidatus Gottesmanbacteria bacterium]